MGNTFAAFVLLNDALTTLNAFAPVITLATQEGRDVTDEELKLAATRCGISIHKLDDLVAAAKGKLVTA